MGACLTVDKRRLLNEVEPGIEAAPAAALVKNPSLATADAMLCIHGGLNSGRIDSVGLSRGSIRCTPDESGHPPAEVTKLKYGESVEKTTSSRAMASKRMNKSAT